MDTVIAFAVLAFFLAMMVMLYRMEVKRHKIYMAKEQAQIDLYNKLYQKLELYGVHNV